jgi:hypothetical protein
MERDSLYGKYIHLEGRAYTVRELRELLAALPDDLPINGDEGIYPVWFNVGREEMGHNGEHLALANHTEFEDDVDVDVDDETEDE